MDLEELILQLQENRKVSTGEEIALFLTAVSSIHSFQDYRNIPALFTGFDDEAADLEMMYEIIHTAESYLKTAGIELYLQMLFQSLVPVSEHGREWIKFMLQRVLNSDTCLFSAKLLVRTCDDETRNLMYIFLDEIFENNPDQFGKSVPELQYVLNEIDEFLNGSDKDE